MELNGNINGSGHLTNGFTSHAQHVPSDRAHSRLVVSEWNLLRQCLEGSSGKKDQVLVKGNGLNIPQVVAVSRYANSVVHTSSFICLPLYLRYGIPAAIDKSEAVLKAIEDSVKFLSDGLANGQSFYGASDYTFESLYKPLTPPRHHHRLWWKCRYANQACRGFAGWAVSTSPSGDTTSVKSEEAGNKRL